MLVVACELLPACVLFRDSFIKRLHDSIIYRNPINSDYLSKNEFTNEAVENGIPSSRLLYPFLSRLERFNLCNPLFNLFVEFTRDFAQKLRLFGLSPLLEIYSRGFIEELDEVIEVAAQFVNIALHIPANYQSVSTRNSLSPNLFAPLTSPLSLPSLTSVPPYVPQDTINFGLSFLPLKDPKAVKGPKDRQPS